jgi:hypothetical protein
LTVKYEEITLNFRSIKYVLVGGHTVAYRGYPRFAGVMVPLLELAFFYGLGMFRLPQVPADGTAGEKK